MIVVCMPTTVVGSGRKRFDFCGRWGFDEPHALENIGEWSLEIIKRSDAAQGFEVLSRRWVVERTFAWLNRCRRLAED